MNIILDTHVLLWWYEDPKLLRKEAQEAIEKPSNNIYLSSAVIWELIIKGSLGKLKIPNALIDGAISDFKELPISIKHTLTLKDLETGHHDFFDRILIAQFLCENYYLRTRDKIILEYKINLIKA